MWTHTLLGLSPLFLLPAASHIAPQPPSNSSPSPQQEQQHRLVDLVPADAFLAFHWNDPAALIARAEESAYVKMLTDPRWAEVFGMQDDEDGEADFEAFRTALAGMQEWVFWVDTSDFEEFDDAVSFGMFHGSEAALDALQSLFQDIREVETWDGMTLYAAEEAMLLREGSWCGFLSSTNEEDGRSQLVAMRDLVHQEEVPAGFFQQDGLADERSGADFEFALRLDFFWEEVSLEAGDEMPEFLLSELEAIAWIYAGGTIGSGDHSDWEIVMPCAPDGLVASLLESLEGPTREDLARIPIDAMTFSGGSFDLQGMIDVMIGAFAEIVPDPESEWENALEQGSQMLGVDLQGDLLDQIEGTSLSFGLEDPSIEIEDLTAYGMTYVFDVYDPAAVTKVIEGVLGFAAMAGLGEDMLDQEDTEWGKTWLINIEDMMEIVLGCDDSSLIFSMDPAGVDAYQALKKNPNPEQSVLANEELQPILAAFDELPMFAAQIPWTIASSMETLVGSFAMEDDPDLDEITQFAEVVSEIALDHLDGWVGYTFETSSNRMRLLVKSR